MSDLFRGRASTWSAGAPASDHEVDATRSFDYSDAATAAALALHSAASTSVASTPVDQLPNSNSNTNGPGAFHYSPVTATDLGSQEFSNSRRLIADKTPESTTSEYPQNFFATTASSPSRSSRDWSASNGANGGGSNSGSGGFQPSSFSVLSVASSSPFSHHAEGGSGLLTPCAGGYGNSSPYTNGSCQPTQQQQQPGLHSGSPSSVGSQLSIAQPNLISTPGAIPTTAAASGGGSSTPIISTGGSSGTKRPARRNPWGSETYSDLIAKAIESYPEKQATLQQIYDYISTNYAYFRERSDPPASAGWKNSIRHNLSLHDKFVKCPKASESSKSSYWRLNANSLNRPYVRRRTCSLDTPGSGTGADGSGVGGKKAKSRLSGGGSGASSAASAAKRAAQIAAAAGGSGGGGLNEIKSAGGIYGGDDLLASLQSSGSSAVTVRSHLNSLSSGITSAFSIPGGGANDALLGLKPDPGPGLNHHPWANSGFLNDRKLPNDELSALCKLHSGDSVSSSSLSLMSGGGGGAYEFQIPRVPPSSSARSSFSSSGIGSDRGSSFLSPPPPLLPSQPSRYHQHQHHHHHQAFSHDQQQRYGPLCDSSPTAAASSNTTVTTTYDQLTGILTGSAECLDGGTDSFLRDDQHQLQHHHPPPPSMSHHHQHPPPPPPPQTNSHLHNLLICGDSSGALSSSALPSAIHGGGGGGGDQQHQQLLSSQDAMELRISLEIANRVKSGEMSSTMQQWAAVAASAARTVENGV